MKRYLFFAGLALCTLLQLKAQDTVEVFNNFDNSTFNDSIPIHVQQKMEKFDETMATLKEKISHINFDSISKQVMSHINVNSITKQVGKWKDLAQAGSKVRNFNNDGETDAAPSRIEKKMFSGISDITVTQQFGNITVKESTGNQVELEIDYFDKGGKQASCTVTTSGKQLSISTDKRTYTENDNPANNYGTNEATFLKVNYVITMPKTIALTVNSKFGKLTIDNIQNLTAHTEFTEVKIDRADKVDIAGKFGKYAINEAKTITGKMQFAPLQVQKLLSKIDISASYSGITLQTISSKIDEISIKGSFSDMTLSLPTNLSATLKASVSFGKIKIDDNYTVKYTSESTTNFNTTKTGQIGSGTPTAKINLFNSYANIKIKK